MRSGILIGTASTVLLTAFGVADANTLKAGDSLNYQYTTAQVLPVPAGEPRELAKQMHPTPGTDTFTFSIAVDRLDPDGSAHATISPHYSGLVLHIRGWSFPDFEGSVLADGQIVPKYDLSLLKGSGLDATSSRVTTGYRPQTHEEQVNFSAYSLNQRLSLFNDVALGAGKRKAFTDGDSWRIVIPDKNNETINFSYTGKQSYRGHDVVVLAFTTMRTTQNGPSPVKGAAYYDPQENLLIGLHFEGDNDTQLGVGAQTIDITLQQ
ncbi:MAG: hypothetical protein GIW99_09675 [Candidatus Eremiobacteraeota bacterium]|nr:hypothetical protein [Candidatus Eremiobacteraeota bacterium]MBC5827930.1 hypothetical protein [Candidatus Eremiobacteraeota bacterium]